MKFNYSDNRCRLSGWLVLNAMSEIAEAQGVTINEAFTLDGPLDIVLTFNGVEISYEHLMYKIELLMEENIKLHAKSLLEQKCVKLSDQLHQAEQVINEFEKKLAEILEVELDKNG